MTATMTKGKRSAAKRPARRIPQRTPVACDVLVPPGTHISNLDGWEAWQRLPRTEREARVRAGRGSLSWVNYSVDEFIAEKRAEAELENRE